ncbi:hypothetical protein N0V83_003016 [Neocucurbitaria cava]|uniref:Uncharacterized protein n=1 Tax=Neocucurbitaria cava TaxID=798079 RepID=A0A9W8YFJ7_9PLEO|nr:hypothetical protein N0V83_003016 [Neocucurbitaria cava]
MYAANTALPLGAEAGYTSTYVINLPDGSHKSVTETYYPPSAPGTGPQLAIQPAFGAYEAQSQYRPYSSREMPYDSSYAPDARGQYPAPTAQYSTHTATQYAPPTYPNPPEQYAMPAHTYYAPPYPGPTAQYSMPADTHYAPTYPPTGHTGPVPEPPDTSTSAPKSRSRRSKKQSAPKPRRERSEEPKWDLATFNRIIHGIGEDNESDAPAEPQHSQPVQDPRPPRLEEITETKPDESVPRSDAEQGPPSSAPEPDVNAVSPEPDYDDDHKDDEGSVMLPLEERQYYEHSPSHSFGGVEESWYPPGAAPPPKEGGHGTDN